MVGKQIRLARLFRTRPDRLLAVALDHAIAHGVSEGIRRIGQALEEVVAGNPDSVTLLKGVAAREFRPYAGRVSLIMKGTTFAPPYPAGDFFVGDVEDAVRLGADAIAVGIHTGTRDQAEYLSALARTVKSAESYGMPVVVHAYPGGPDIEGDDRFQADLVVYAVRAAAEIGADVIKTYYTGNPDSFAKVVEAAHPARVVLSGGPKRENFKEVLQTAFEALRAGSAGVTYGRNVWEGGEARATLAALRRLVHDDASVEAALEVYLARKSTGEARG